MGRFDLRYEVEGAAMRIRQMAEGENAFIKKRAAAISADVKKFLVELANIPEYVDYVGTAEQIELYYAGKIKHHFCCKCGKDITLLSGMVFPQEPKKVYCTACGTRISNKQLGID
mgnify:CR=1 FL=1